MYNFRYTPYSTLKGPQGKFAFGPGTPCPEVTVDEFNALTPLMAQALCAGR